MRRKCNGAKTTHRSLGIYRKDIGRGALYTGRSHTERSGGLYTRENAGMSSESVARNHTVECLRFPGEGSSTQGKSGAKPRLNSVGDAELVEIPVP
jgi:hypothetical protein